MPDIVSQLKTLKLHGMADRYTELQSPRHGGHRRIRIADPASAGSRSHRPRHSLYQLSDGGR